MKGITKVTFSTFALKMIAIVFMLIDHMGAVLFPKIMIFRIVGRIVLPIFAFTLVEGFIHTKDVRKYIMRVGTFALLSEIPFDLALSGKILEFGHQNVFFTLLLGLVMLACYARTNDTLKQLAVVALTVFAAKLFNVDYSGMAIVMIFLFYYLWDKKLEKLFAVGILIILMSGVLQLFSLLALIPIALYNGERGPKIKGFFYAFYPIHLLVLYFVSLWL